MRTTRGNRQVQTWVVLVAACLTVISSSAIAQNEKEISRAIANMEDPSKSLWITVESVPSGATVYGVRDGQPGRRLGTTPITLKYTMNYAKLRKNVFLYGTASDETVDWDLTNTKVFLAFKCFVVRDGYAPYYIYNVIEDREDIAWFSQRIKALDGGQRTFTALLEPIGRQSKSPGLHSVPQQQIQRRNQEPPRQDRGPGQALVTLAQLGLLLGTGNPQTLKAASLLNTVGRMEFERELVERGSNLNININQGEYQQNVRGYDLPQNVLYDGKNVYPAPGYSWLDPTDPNDVRVQRSLQIFASYPWIDFNKDGTVDFPDEFPARGQREFYATERVIFVWHDAESKGIEREVRWEIYTPQGKVSLSNGLRTSMGDVKVGQEGEENLTAWLVENGGYGTHTIVWYVNDYPVGSTQVRIVPAPEKK